MDTQPYEKDVKKIEEIMVSVSILPFYGSIALVILARPNGVLRRSEASVSQKLAEGS